MDVVRGAAKAQDDGLAQYRELPDLNTEAQFEVLMGIRDAASETASSSAVIAADIRTIKNDPTGRNTLHWAIATWVAAFLTLMASIIVPSVVSHGDAVQESAREARYEIEHQDSLKELRALHDEIRLEHDDEAKRERILINLLQSSKRG